MLLDDSDHQQQHTHSATSLSDLTAAHKHFQINQRLKNLRRSFNSANKKPGPSGSLSYMASNCDLNKLSGGAPCGPPPESSSDHSSLTRKPSESNLLLGHIDLNTHHERSGGFLFFGTRRKIPNHDLMVWTSQTIQKPLIRTSNKVIKREACDLFKLVQMYMGDRRIAVDTKQYVSKTSLKLDTSVDENTASYLQQLNLNLAHRDLVCLEIMTKGWLHAQLRDELYLQIIKQTTSNASKQGDLFGWQLMAVCLSFFPPTHKLHPFLSEYIVSSANGTSNSHSMDSELATSSGTLTRSAALDEEAVYLTKLTGVCGRRLARIHLTGAKRGLRAPTLDEIVLSRKTILNASLFGTTLDEIMHVQRRKWPTRSLPWVQTALSEAVLRLNGARTEGIFRVPGDLDEVNTLKVRLDQLWCSDECVRPSGERDLLAGVTDPHLPASLLKLWYRELHEPLIPDEFYEECIASSADARQCVHIIEHRLPSTNRLVFTYLIRFLKVFAAGENVALTKMDSANLSMVMAPNCLRCQSEEPRVIMENTKKEMQFLRTLIQHLDTSIVEGVS
jgi:hypothetical protein